MNKNVSVIIPTYNRAQKLKNAIKTVLNQTYPYFELIIIDDNSSDETDEVVQSFNDERIRYIKNDENLGQVRARNKGIELSNYDFIAFLDDDDEWLPNKLKMQVKSLNSLSEEYCGVFTGIYVIENGKIIDTKVPQVEGDVFRDLLTSKGCSIGNITFMLKRDALEKVGGFSSDLPAREDFELSLKLAKKYKFGIIKKPLVKVNFDSKDRVTTDYSKILTATERIYAKYKETIKKDKKIYAKFMYKLAILELLNNNKNDSIKYLEKAIKTYPINIKYLSVRILVGLFPNLYCLLRDFLKH